MFLINTDTRRERKLLHFNYEKMLLLQSCPVTFLSPFFIHSVFHAFHWLALVLLASFFLSPTDALSWRCLPLSHSRAKRKSVPHLLLRSITALFLQTRAPVGSLILISFYFSELSCFIFLVGHARTNADVWVLLSDVAESNARFYLNNRWAKIEGKQIFIVLFPAGK